MRIYTLRRTTTINADHKAVWDYFSSPKNLNEITPPDMKFEFLTNVEGVKMYPGMIINYRIRPFSFVAFRWTTEITHCEEGKYFVDEQRFGPYSFWHHQHHFERSGNNIVMTDIVSYGLPFGPIGWLVNQLYIGKKLNGIFDYRETVINTIFSKKS